MRHTKGPWKIHDSGQIIAWDDFAQESTTVCFVGSNDTCEQEDFSNASLIAAAPDILEELEQLREALNDSVLSTGSKTMDEEILYNIQKIIKKAKVL